MAAPRYQPYSIRLADIRWSCQWIVTPDRMLEVCSAYGWRARKLGRRKPEKLAHELLMEILWDKAAGGSALSR